MTTQENAALTALDTPITAENLVGATVETNARPAKVTVSARIPPELVQPLMAEAQRRNQPPSQLIAELIAEGLTARHQRSDVVQINLADLHRAIDQVADRAA